MDDETKHLIRQLSADDGRALDTVLAERTGEAVDAGPELSRARIEAARRSLAIFDLYEVSSPSADLTQRTLQRLLADEQRKRFAYQISSLAKTPMREVGRFQIGRWMEIAVGAAMIIVGISLALPSLDHSRNQARQIGCATNLVRAGTGFGQYAADHNNRLPRIDEVQPGEIWIRVGQPGPDGRVQSNSAHMYKLVRGGYVTIGQLACPENQQAVRQHTPHMIDWPHPGAPSYSYQNQHGFPQLRLEQIHQKPVLADRNPLFEVRGGQLVQNLQVDPRSNSRQHAQQGQNMLVADGSVFWRLNPVLDDGDNIWIAEGIVRYTGRETPASADDVHLVP